MHKLTFIGFHGQSPNEKFVYVYALDDYLAKPGNVLIDIVFKLFQRALST